MSEPKLCPHLASLTPLKPSKLIPLVGQGKKCWYKQALCKLHHHIQGSPQCSGKSRWLCLGSGKVGCGRKSFGKCMMKHYKEMKLKPKSGGGHPVVVMNPITKIIWCYECDCSITEQLQMAQLYPNPSEPFKKDLENMIKLEDEIIRMVMDPDSFRNKAGEIDDKSALVVRLETGKLEEEENGYLGKRSVIALGNMILGSGGGGERAVVKRVKRGESSCSQSSVFGSLNLGNTCFFNSIMQCLSSSRGLVDEYAGRCAEFNEKDEFLRSEFFSIFLLD